MTSSPEQRPDPQASLRSTFQTLAAGGPQVAEALLHIAVHGKSEVARVQAAIAVLDRIGLPSRVDVGIHVADLLPAPAAADSGAVDVVRQRLSLLRAAMSPPTPPQTAAEAAGA